jgi:hypothetical protein
MLKPIAMNVAIINSFTMYVEIDCLKIDLSCISNMCLIKAEKTLKMAVLIFSGNVLFI